MSECKDRFYLNKKTYPGIIFPDRDDASKRRLRGRGRIQPNVGTSHGVRVASLRAGDGAHRDIEREKLGRWRRARREWRASRAQHAREA